MRSDIYLDENVKK